VLATCRQQADCDRLIAEGLDSFRLDYADNESIHQAFAMAMDRTGAQLDALYNDGAHGLGGAIEDIPTEGFRAIFEANFFGWHELTRLAIPIMRAQGRGRIIQCSSILGFVALRMRSHYIATKFALEGYTDTLRLELAGTDINVILFEPGPIRTRIRVNSQPHYEKWVERENTPWADFYREKLEPRLYAVDPARERFELTCDASTAKLIRALEDPRPRPRYFVTTPSHFGWYLRRLLPTRWLDRLLIRG
jgi:NAD(P)-dependent dehydrogenase (short-subunit alcohol dehydrogenase family)